MSHAVCCSVLLLRQEDSTRLPGEYPPPDCSRLVEVPCKCGERSRQQLHDAVLKNVVKGGNDTRARHRRAQTRLERKRRRPPYARSPLCNHTYSQVAPLLFVVSGTCSTSRGGAWRCLEPRRCPVPALPTDPQSWREVVSGAESHEGADPRLLGVCGCSCEWRRSAHCVCVMMWVAVDCCRWSGSQRVERSSRYVQRLRRTVHLVPSTSATFSSSSLGTR